MIGDARAAKNTQLMIYFVKNSGGNGSGADDANAWSPAKYNASFNSLAPGDTVKFKNGETFYGVLNVKSGTQTAPITFDTYGTGAPAVISGFVTLTNWTLLSGNIYYATLSTSVVYVATLDGASKAMGRYPNTGYLTYTGHTANTAISGATIGALPASFVGGEVVIKKYRYIIDRHKITAQTKTQISYSVNNNYGQNGSYEPTDGNGFFIENHLATLDQEGEWYYDPASKRFYMHFGAGTPAGRTVKASTVNQLVTLNSATFINFNNIDFEGANVALQNNGTSNITTNNCNFRQLGTGIYGADLKNIQINGGSITDCQTNGVMIEVGGNSTIISGVTFNRNGMLPGMGESGDGKYNAIKINGNFTTVRNCTIKNTGYNGIDFIGNNVLIENNLIDSFCITKDDGAGIYTYADAKDVCVNRIIRNNIILNAIGNAEGALANGDQNGEAAGVYVDNNSNHTEVSNNTIAYGNWAGIFINANSDNSVINNTVFDHKYQLWIQTKTLSGYQSVRNTVITGNKFIAKTAAQKTILLSLYVNDNPANMGVFDNNVYARPIDDNATIHLFKQFNGSTNESDMSLIDWKNSFKVDPASAKSALTVSNPSDFRFNYNNTPQPASVDLGGGVFKDVANNVYNGSITLPPFSGAVLAYSGSTPPPPPPPPPVDVITGTITINGKNYKLVPVQ